LNGGPAPLAGVRVLEFGGYVAGGSAGRLLADLGADVIKVEPPEGDGLRTWGSAAPDGTSWWFKAHNRNKRFVCLDLHDERERAIARELALRVDVLIENFRPGVMARWGLDYGTLHALEPRLVYASISGYGQDGPYTSRAGFGNVAEAMGGIRYVTGYPDRAPVRVGFSLADELAAQFCVIGVLAALHARDRDGAGDHVDASLLESCVSVMEGALPEYGADGKVRERRGNQHLSVAPSNVYPTKDGKWLAIGGNADGVFRRLAAAMGTPALADDPRFSDNAARTRNVDALEAEIVAWTSQHDAAEATRILAESGVPAGPVNSVADIARDEHLASRDFIIDLRDEREQPVRMAAPVPRFETHHTVRSHAARGVGADTDAVLREFGLAVPAR
jgi:crotonobetainyl-CoA:carnitine CoA-transferase CaiB-like acyl-CoA transferase